jgi:hypothetical protein
MKSFALRLIVFLAVYGGAHSRLSAAPAKATPPDYNLSAHVSGARYDSAFPLNQILTITVAAKHYEVEGGTSSAKAYMHGNGLLDTGDYPAKLVLDSRKTPFESIEEFEFFLPDGTTRRFNVIAQWE